MFTGESAASGGAVYDDTSSATLTNCVFANNTATYAGGALCNSRSTAVVTNGTFANNVADYSGGGIYSELVSRVAVTNSILWGDTAASASSELVATDTEPFMTVTNSVVQGGYDAGTNVIATNPLFVAAANGDLRLSAGSPAIDAGDGCAVLVTLADRAGNPRWDISGAPNATNGVDVGALEFQGTAGTDTRLGAFGCP